MITRLNKNSKFDSRIKNKKLVERKDIKDAVKWSITEYSLFVSKMVKKGLSLNNQENLGKGWFSGVYMNNKGEVKFTDPFTMENRPNSKYDILGAVGSFKLDDTDEYHIILETNNKFVEVLDNQGEIDPEFHLKDYKMRLNPVSSNTKSSSKASIRKYDDAVSFFIKNEIQKGSFLDLFEIYIEEKLKILNKSGSNNFIN
jgi:hypothetical protein